MVFHLALALMTLQPNLGLARSGILFSPTARIDENSLGELISSPVIQSFDISPDGKALVLLVVAGSKVGAPLWLVTVDAAAKRVTSSRELGTSTFPAGGFAPQVLYASEGRNVIVQDLQTVQVLEAGSLKPLRTISPPSGEDSRTPLFIASAGNRDVLVCAFGHSQKLDPRFHTTPARVAVVDVSSGQRLGEWNSGDVPQSISPNGHLIAVSSLEPHQGVLPLSVVDVRGQKVSELTGRFGFTDARASEALGRVLGFFVGNEEVLLAPDENVDATGHHSGDGLQLVSVAGTGVEVQQKITPRHYAPQGELAVSANGRTAVATSWYVPARMLANEGALPASSPELLVFERNTSFGLDASVPIHGLGLKASGWLENRRPRLSSDGSVIAIAQDGGVTVLTKSSVSSEHP